MWNLQIRIIGRYIANTIAKFSGGGIVKTEIQAEILQIFQEVEFTNQDYR